ncbi:hypothetical protein [Candidatus Pelagibacter communis]|uniref:hypothetical protein n=1 Tax=Pelagibacter ubique TaxID=198252 RepID=UPI00092D1B58|nr:hypothetical protein [Candidatus Pelagibacter ubique]
MRKTNFFVKYLNNISKLINNLLEKNLNKINFKNLSYLFKNNKIILTFVALFVIFISYLLLPTFYKQSDVSKVLNTELQKKLDLNFIFSKKIKYNLFPIPHFTTTAKIINDEQTEISKIKNLKIFVSLDNFFSFKNIQIKDLVIENANFNLNKKNYNFFLNLLNKNFKDGNLIIKKSNVFFRNTEDEVLLINKILKLKYFYEPKEFKNIFYLDNEIFNIPFSIETFFNEDKSKIFSEINIDIMKLKIKNELNLDKDVRIGKSEFNINKIKHFADYKIEKNYLNFQISDKADQPNKKYDGKFNFKPFYASLEGEAAEINLSYIFGNNAIISELLKTEIFNNKNIDFKLNINADRVYGNSNFRNINLKSKIKDGLIDTDKTRFEWRDFATFELLESLIFVRDGELVLDGKLKININNYNEIYKFLLTPKNYRNEINKIDLNFTYNFDQKIAELKDIKVDNKIDLNINKILNNVILKKDNLQNKIYFKNLLNDAIKSYAG